jgi:ABC-type glycerol-3-phosphate transport system permease component
MTNGSVAGSLRQRTWAPADGTRPGRRRPRRRWKVEDNTRILPSWLSRTVLVAMVLFVLVPVVYMLVLSVTPNSKVALGGVSLSKPDFANYAAIWSAAPLAGGLVHTLIIAGAAAAISVAFGLLAAYPLTRMRFTGRRAFLYGLLGSQTVPGTTLVLPLFATFSFIQTLLGVHVIGSYPPIIFTYMTFGLPLSTWLLVAYLRTIPRELEDAGLVDGCSRVKALRRIVLPIALPAVVVAFVFAFLVGWNDLLFASVFTNNGTQTLAVVMQSFANTQAGSGLPLYGDLMAAAVVSAVPVVVLYLVFQRYLIRGLSAGSMAGI